jgi:REP element-mobilizing transposase RayT
MPNHIYGIIVITNVPVRAGLVPAHKRATTRVALTIGDIVGVFKSITTVLYTRGVKQSHWPPFHGRLWQRNYFEHIIRNDKSLDLIRRYIMENPLRWGLDRGNPNAIGQDHLLGCHIRTG